MRTSRTCLGGLRVAHARAVRVSRRRGASGSGTGGVYIARPVWSRPPARGVVLCARECLGANRRRFRAQVAMRRRKKCLNQAVSCGVAPFCEEDVRTSGWPFDDYGRTSGPACRGVSGVPCGRFQKLLFRLTKLLTRALDSNNFCRGVTDRKRNHGCDAFHPTLCRPWHQGWFGEKDHGIDSLSCLEAVIRRTYSPPGRQPSSRHQQRPALRSVPSCFYWATTAN